MIKVNQELDNVWHYHIDGRTKYQEITARENYSVIKYTRYPFDTEDMNNNVM